MTGFIVSVFPFRNRVSSKEAFEGLELGERKLSRPVLRGPGGRKVARLLGNYRSKDGNERSRRGRKRSLRNGASPRFGLMTLIAEKREGAWQVVVAQNTNAMLGTPSELQQIKTPIAIPGTQSKPWGPALPDLSELCM
jgi:hypothetical protein